MKLKDRVAIVTGGARGIGKAYALRLCEEGARVVVADVLDTNAAMQAIDEMGGVRHCCLYKGLGAGGGGLWNLCQCHRSGIYVE